MGSPTSVDNLAHLLLARLERISADSYWAHRASGVRGSLVRMVAQLDRGEAVDREKLQHLLEAGFHLLAHAAEERTGNKLQNGPGQKG